MTKYIFITGGVVSSLGKGIVAASLGRLLTARGFKVANQKFDPYLNVNTTNMSPFQHGEVFVTDDGLEADLDLGHYERFTDTSLSKVNSMPAGQIYTNVLEKERRGEYNGGTVQIVPHVTNEIKAGIQKAAKSLNPDFLIVEIGGTIGDIESLPHIEAIRQFITDVGSDNAISVHVTLLPYLPTSAELKTKPSQHSVNTLRGFGIQPEILVCRTQKHIAKEEKDKLALFCSIEKDCVIECMDMNSIYKVPMALEDQGMAIAILRKLNVAQKEPDLKVWRELAQRAENPKHALTVAIIGEYPELNDAYLSVVEALKHAGFATDAKINIKWIASEMYLSDEQVKADLEDTDAVVIPGVYGSKGIEGKIKIAKYARENNIPFLGISMGFQVACVEFARNVLNLADANSTEFNKNTSHPVVDTLEEIKSQAGYDIVLRLGAYECNLKSDSKAANLYGQNSISERHRHRLELNGEYIKSFEQNGLNITGYSADALFAEVIEFKNNDFYIACQFHPEFKSRPDRPHPLFLGLLKTALKKADISAAAK